MLHSLQELKIQNRSVCCHVYKNCTT